MTTALLEEKPKTKLNLQLIVPTRKTKLSPTETITGRRYDIVLVCQPDAKDHYPFYGKIVRLVERKKNLRIYSPHNDAKRNISLEEVVSLGAGNPQL